MFNIANTVPNMLYILLAGGVFNAVLVPQLVRAMKHDPDGGEAYTNRIITLAGAVPRRGHRRAGGRGAAADAAVPRRPSFDDPELPTQRESSIAFARYCLPQVFFYGMFVLVGQVLNSRRRFGPMMWAPIANNVIAIAVLVIYLLAYGPAPTADAVDGYTTGQEVLLGLGSTLGIAVQLLVLLPYLRAAGFHYKPRFDFRGTGLGHTLRLGMWTVLFVVVNQIAYTVVMRIASSGTARPARGRRGGRHRLHDLLQDLPGRDGPARDRHRLPGHRRAAAAVARRRRRPAPAWPQPGRSTMRTALALIIPFALVLPVIALASPTLVWKYGAASGTYDASPGPSSLFGVGLVFFTSHYLVLRGFYALERTRTVFWVQCVIAATNIALAVVLVGAHRRRAHRARAGASPTPRPTSSARRVVLPPAAPMLGGLGDAAGAASWCGS